jgi:hypothetical protein
MAIKRTENHEYKDGDIIYPGVTDVLQDVGIIQNSRFATPGRGKRMHKIVEYFFKNKLDFSDLNQEELDLINWIVEIIKDYKLEIVECEKPLCNKIYHYAGTEDYIFIQRDNNKYFIADLKTGIKKKRWFKIQIAAYREAFAESDNVHGLILYQRTKEVELVTEQELQQKYFPVFKSALDVYNFKYGGIYGN